MIDYFHDIFTLFEFIILLNDNVFVVVQDKLDKPMRQKIMCLITMDAYSRDILDNLITLKVCRVDDFNWQVFMIATSLLELQMPLLTMVMNI